MASTTALFTGLSGLTANAANLNVIGNNIANSNTTAFKSSRMLFSTQFSRTFNNGSPPDATDGGTNPVQVGLGVQIAGTQRDFTQGSIAATGNPGDLAIQGKGFFIVQQGNSQLYTRAGAFQQDRDGNLVTVNGDHVLGFGVDSNFNIVPGALGPLNIPLGSLTLAQATTGVDFVGNLNASGSVATQGSSTVLGSTSSTGFSLIPTATMPANPPDVLETTSLLREISDPQAPGNPLFSPGQIIEIKGAQRGTATIDPARFTVGATSTVQDLMTFFRDALGVDPATGPNPGGAMPGVALDPLTGKLTITGNTGTTNSLEVDSNDVRLLDSSGTFLRNPLNSNTVADATGESVKTTFVVYDSLGSPLAVDVRMTLESKGNGTTWRYDVDCPADSNLSSNVTTGRISFDSQGALSTVAPVPIQIDLAGTGAATPLDIQLHFANDGDTITSFSSSQSTLTGKPLDGAALGTLAAFGIGSDGTITGAFDNGLTRTLGQVALATFSNQEGLVDAGNNLFQVGANSGPPVVTTPGQSGTGPVVNGALELSNVDLGQEFIKMILASTGYSASSRVIKTTDDLLQQLLVLGR
jgi:flagellar hook protein FlgE